METNKLSFGTFFWRITSSHMITYFIAGILAFYFLNYKELFETGTLSHLMRPSDSPWVAAGPGLQIIRGLVFSIVLWPFTSIFLSEKTGWLKLWLLLIGLSILSTTGPAPGSIEGMIYTVIPIKKQVIGYIEVIPQTCLFAFMVCYWYHYPKKVWNIISIILIIIIVLFGVAGILGSGR